MVGEFLAMFKIVTKSISSKDSAHYLYSNYLSKYVQSMVKHCKNDLEKMIATLVSKFGDVSRILDEKLSQVRL